MKKTEINELVRMHEEAVEAEKAAKKTQTNIMRALRDELYKFKALLQEDGPMKFAKPIDASDRYGVKEVIGIFYDDGYKTLFPEGRVRLMVKENGVFDHNNGVTETASLMAEVLLTATKIADKMFVES